MSFVFKLYICYYCYYCYYFSSWYSCVICMQIRGRDINKAKPIWKKTCKICYQQLQQTQSNDEFISILISSLVVTNTKTELENTSISVVGKQQTRQIRWIDRQTGAKHCSYIQKLSNPHRKKSYVFFWQARRLIKIPN